MPLRSSFTVPSHPDKHGQTGSKASSQAVVLNGNQAGTQQESERQSDLSSANPYIPQAEQLAKDYPDAGRAYRHQSAAQQAQMQRPQQSFRNDDDDMCGPMELTWEGVLQAATGSARASDQSGQWTKTEQQ